MKKYVFIAATFFQIVSAWAFEVPFRNDAIGASLASSGSTFSVLPNTDQGV
jgi:hypothetical protein